MNSPTGSRTVAPTTALIAIDWTRCDGHGICHALAPERIEVDEWGFPILRDATVSDSELPAARRIVAACPALALQIQRVPRPR